MRYVALATDYDGTIAKDGDVDQATLAALQRWRDSGRQLILITGRRFDDLLTVFSAVDQFDWVVTENGATLYKPASQQQILLGEPPSLEFVQVLRDRIDAADLSLDAVPSEEFRRLLRDRVVKRLEVGQVIVATWEPYLAIVEATIIEMEVQSQIILNKGALMILPQGVDKAAGLLTVLEQLHTDPAAVIGVGDAENDVIFLKRCGYSVAVANALPSVKQQVDWVTSGDRGIGVQELIERFIDDAND
ncbi:MAG: HAD family phosphatase [Leptolyngbyaceae cyanobacterium SL_7_1]|nr:HAD family phosphatase [Leptolyngbyaceae cyanobacterium SL_7_1]